MNYIQEINAIHRDFEISGLSPKARLLWLVLLDLNNRQHWPRSFQAPAAFLMNQCGFSAKSLQRAREELTAAGQLGLSAGGQRPAGALYPALSERGQKGHICPGSGGYQTAGDLDGRHHGQRRRGALAAAASRAGNA